MPFAEIRGRSMDWATPSPPKLNAIDIARLLSEATVFARCTPNCAARKNIFDGIGPTAD
jgi:hypothetical protein